MSRVLYRVLYTQPSEMTFLMHVADGLDPVEHAREAVARLGDDTELVGVQRVQVVTATSTVSDPETIWRKDAQLNDKPALDAEYLQVMQEPTYFDPSRKEVSSDAEVPTDRDSDA